MSAQPTGTVTLLFSDIEGSTRLLEGLGAERYSEVLELHRRLLREAFAAHDGYEVDTEGDSFFVAFHRAEDAVAAAEQAQQALGGAEWPDGATVRVRMGVHTGAPLSSGPNYVGADVHRAARIMAAGHGGQVVVSATTRALVDGELSALGEHRLKDFDEPVALFQIGSESFPPLKTISNTNLPRPASSLIGRERERDELVAMLGNGSRLVTLSGPGGSGKSRLALETATELVPEFEAGVFWIELATLRDPALVTETVGRTLGSKNGLAEHVGDREMLLVLDNFEQVVEAAPQLGGLMTACPKLRCLVTSRELLRISGEVDYPVLPLAEGEAVELFCARSRLEPDPAIAELCAHLDNMPLAVELAAARARLLSPAEILDRLSQQLDLLKGGRDADPRQQTLRATIDWSHELLSTEEQTLFRRLAVFRGGCTLDAAESVADADLDTLQSLLDKSLLRRTGDRFWMLETIRAYARERLAEIGDEAEWRERHGEYFLDFAESNDPQQAPGGRDLAVMYAHVDAEIDNLRAALEWARDSGDHERLLRLAASLEYYWSSRGLWHETHSWNALALERGSSPARARMSILNQESWHYARERDWEAADARVAEWLRIAEQEGDEHEALRAQNAAALQATDKGDFEAARRLFEEVGARAAEAGDRMILAFVAVNLAGLFIQEGDYAAGIEYGAKAVELFRELGDENGQVVAIANSAWCSLALADPAQAASDFHTSLGPLARQGAFRTQQATGTLEGFGISLVSLRLVEAGVRILGGAEALREEIGFGHRDPLDIELRDAAIAAAKADLGEEAFSTAWKEGEAMSPEDVMAFALQVPLPAAGTSSG